jgi:hypothetical protein
MNTIKGYRVRMWTSDKNIHSEKFFASVNLLEARREAFAYADNLVEIMEEAKQAGVISYNKPEEILDPAVKIEDVVIGSVHVTVVYEEVKEDLIQTEEDLIYMPVANEGSTVEIQIDNDKIMQVTSIEAIDLTDEETVRIHNKEAGHYIRTGGHQGIVFLMIENHELLLLMDDFVRLKNKKLILVEEENNLKKAV